LEKTIVGNFKVKQLNMEINLKNLL